MVRYRMSLCRSCSSYIMTWGIFLGLPSHLSLQSGGWEQRLRRLARTSCICTGPAKSWRAWACRKCFPLAVIKIWYLSSHPYDEGAKPRTSSIQGNLDNTRIWWSSHPLGNSVAKHWFTASTGAVEPYRHDDISTGSWLEARGLPFVVYGIESPASPLLTSSSWSNSGITEHIPTWIRTTVRMGERKVANALDSLETWRLRTGTLATTSACQKSLSGPKVSWMSSVPRTLESNAAMVKELERRGKPES